MIAALLAAAAIASLCLLFKRDAERERRRRREFFADCMALFGACRVTQTGLQFPVLEGKYKGLPIRLEPLVDDAGVRKVPSLWLKTTLLVPNPRRGVLDFLVRPQGCEFYSPSHDLPKRLPIPADWPQHAVLCTEREGIAPPLERFEPHICVFDDPRMKEMLITPRGVRLVYQAAQADRGEYLVLRQARFANMRLDPALVRRLLDRVISIASDLDADADIGEAQVA